MRAAHGPRAALPALLVLAALGCAPGGNGTNGGDVAPRRAATGAQATAGTATDEPRRSIDSLLPGFYPEGRASTADEELDLPAAPAVGVRFDAFELEPPEVVPPAPPELEALPFTTFEGLPVRVEERRFADGRLMSRRYVWCDPRSARDIDHGPDRRWHPNGVLAAWRTWIAGKLNGPVLEWAEGGARQSARTYVDDLIDGVSVEFDAIGRPAKMQEWRLGTAHGGRWSWWARPTGAHSEDLFEDGVQVGRHRQWSRGGFLNKDGELEGGERHGMWTMWHDNGVPRAHGAYEHGREHGPWTRWNAGGARVELETFAHGQLDGLSVRWNAAGGKLREARYQGGKLHGAQREWWSSGGLKSIITYVDGASSGPVTYWYEGGAKQVEGVMEGGAREGRWTYWRADGTIDPTWSGEYASDVKVEAQPTPPNSVELPGDPGSG